MISLHQTHPATTNLAAQPDEFPVDFRRTNFRKMAPRANPGGV